MMGEAGPLDRRVSLKRECQQLLVEVLTPNPKP